MTRSSRIRNTSEALRRAAHSTSTLQQARTGCSNGPATCLFPTTPIGSGAFRGAGESSTVSLQLYGRTAPKCVNLAVRSRRKERQVCLQRRILTQLTLISCRFVCSFFMFSLSLPAIVLSTPQLGLTGVTFLVASGDDGSHSTSDPHCLSQATAPDWPASSPWVLSVGATEFRDGGVVLGNASSFFCQVLPVRLYLLFKA